MGLFGLFGQKKNQVIPDDWVGVAGKVSGMLLHLMNADPRMLASQYARVVLRSDWSVGLATDRRDPDKILAPDDVSFAFIQEDRAALAEWVNQLKANPNPQFQVIATEEYAKKLVRTLMQGVEVR